MGVKALPEGRYVAALAGFAVAMLSSATASAQAAGPERASASAAVTLVVDLAPVTALDAERLRDAVARELGAPVIWGRDGKGGTLYRPVTVISLAHRGRTSEGDVHDQDR
jgi:hypothetical protein